MTSPRFIPFSAAEHGQPVQNQSQPAQDRPRPEIEAHPMNERFRRVDNNATSSLHSSSSQAASAAILSAETQDLSFATMNIDSALRVSRGITEDSFWGPTPQPERLSARIVTAAPERDLSSTLDFAPAPKPNRGQLRKKSATELLELRAQKAALLGAMTPGQLHARRAPVVLPANGPEREERRLALLDVATYELGRLRPEYSAVPVITNRQRAVLLSLAVCLILSTILKTVPTLRVLVVLSMFAYTSTLWLRVQLVRHAFRENRIIDISDEDARAFPEDLLPVYSVLIPAYKEPEVIDHLLGSVALLEYPTHKLEVKLLLEEDDFDTIRAIEAKAARGEVLPSFIEVVLVPAGLPRTKPKACNYGLKLCTGSMVTIYDAEDIPEPLQLRRAAIALLTSPDEVACVQARLEFHNHRDNLLTKWFTVEYAQWFTQLLPGLVSMGGPIPLGGTSNHFKRDVLDEVGAWDPFNVTEDADLGVRLQREGYKVGVVQSVTLEEANCDFVNWIKQRSRWYKGYLLSFLVHLRDPKRTYREVGGWRPFRNFALFVGGTPLLGALSLLMMGVSALWSLGRFPLIADLFPGWVGSLALLLAVVGNLIVIISGLVTLRLTDKERLVGAVLLLPLYGVMMSIAATKAIVQLVTDPFHWEKTAHGLSASVQHTQVQPGTPSQHGATSKPGATPPQGTH
jgi:glycosyltransferase XagB